jgi:hypothetical protein
MRMQMQSFQTSLPELLTALPETVVTASGQVVHVRSGVRDHITQDPNRRATTATASASAAAEAPAAAKQLSGGGSTDGTAGDESQGQGQEGNLVKLRIKSDSGTAAMIVELPGHATIGDVKQSVAARRTLNTEFQLRATFPFPRAFDDDSLTLLEAGLVPSATLMVQSTTLTPSPETLQQQQQQRQQHL